MPKKPRIIFMPHANIQYSQLDPARRKWVCENSYRPLFELVRDGGYRIAFEASGEDCSNEWLEPVDDASYPA